MAYQLSISSVWLVDLSPRAATVSVPPDEKPPAPVIGMDGTTEDGAVPYQILMKQLEFLR